jgi:hypothetical protein
MTRVARLLTLVDLNDGHDEGPEARRLDVSARLEAVLADGRRVVLLDDRGWSELGHIDFDHEPTPEERARELSRIRIWDHQTVEGMAETAREVVGPDDDTDAHVAAHWSALAHDLRRQGVEVAAAELASLPHDVELSDRVLARIRGQ